MLETFLSTGDFFIRCALSLVLGAMIGLEREYKNKPAGLKTHTLICVGSTALTYLSIHFSPQGDPGRIAAQIVSGIGFIGGGAILQSRKAVKGLTTAATLWVAASVGMLIGGHFFIPAILLSILVTLFLIFARPFSTMEKLQKNYVTTIQFKQIEIGEKIITLAKKFQLQTASKTISSKKMLSLELSYATTPITHHLFLKKSLKLKGVEKIMVI